METKENKEKTVMMFIDGSNFYFHSKKLLQANALKFNWAGLVQDIYHECTKDLNYNCRLVSAYYYAGLPDPKNDIVSHNKQKKFLNAITAVPFITVKTGYVMRNAKTGKDMEKGIDTMLSVDMVFNAIKDLCDILILVSADGDFQYVVKVVSKQDKEVIVCHPIGAYSVALKIVSSKIITLDREFLAKHINK